MFTAFINSTIANSSVGHGAAPRRAGATARQLRLVHSSNNPCRHDAPESRAVAAARRAKRPVLMSHWHVVPSTGRLECAWSEQQNDGTSAEQPGPSRRRGRMRRGAGFASTLWPALQRAA